MPARMCGDARTAGAVYVSVPLGPDGRPLEDFIVDAPIPIDPDALGVSAVGMTLIEREGVWHLLDWIGEESYPNVCDFLEEVRALGLSRKISRTTDFAKLTPASKIILIHRRARIENAAEYQRERMRWEYTSIDRATGEQAGIKWCPKEIEAHTRQDFEGMCASLWHEDIEGGRTMDTASVRFVLRDLPCRTYQGFTRPLDVTPQYQPAIFAAFPVTQLEVIRDGMANSHEETLLRAAEASVPVLLTEE